MTTPSTFSARMARESPTLATHTSRPCMSAAMQVVPLMLSSMLLLCNWLCSSGRICLKPPAGSLTKLVWLVTMAGSYAETHRLRPRAAAD